MEVKKFTGSELNRAVSIMSRSLSKMDKQKAAAAKAAEKAAAKAAAQAAKAAAKAATAAAAAAKKRARSEKAAEKPAKKAKKEPSAKPKAPKGEAAAKRKAEAKPKASTSKAPKAKSAAPVAKKPKGKEKAKEEVREVEKIVAVRPTKTGGQEFLIKWKGLGPRENNWEPEDNVLDETLLDEYMHDRLLKMAPKDGKYPVGAPVDVLGVADGFGNSWAPGKVLKANKPGTKYDVEYADFMDGKKKLVEADIEIKRLRPLQAKPAKAWKPTPGDIVEVLEDDVWWEGRVLALEAKKKVDGLKVKLRVSDETSWYALDTARPSCWWNSKK
mmetsp:Transcript_7804/g.26525  ORF Transcript_7804/g.26525 Transcript_7804/m.26525 type:complete len:328 (+) Transcript_7804:48-1031(+)